MFSIGSKIVIASILFVIICEFNVESFLGRKKHRVIDVHAVNLAQVKFLDP